MLMYAANIFFWRRYRVNYSFIFGFKQGTELGYREVFLLSSCLAVMALAGVIYHLDVEVDQKTKSYTNVTEFVPLVLVTVSSTIFYSSHCKCEVLIICIVCGYSSIYTSKSHIVDSISIFFFFPGDTSHSILPIQHSISFKPFLSDPMCIPLYVGSSIQGSLKDLLNY